MKATQLTIPDVFLLEPSVYKDERGSFFESFNQNKFETIIGKKITFVHKEISADAADAERSQNQCTPTDSVGLQ